MSTRFLRLSRISPALALGFLTSCSSDSSPVTPTPPPSPPAAIHVPAPPPAPPPQTFGGTAVLVGAGDIGFCGAASGAEATGRLLDRIPGTVFAAGDNAYMNGTAEEYRKCYDPGWGRHRARTRPVPGNHEYGSGAAGYFEYFGANAGPAGAGYYSYAAGSWQIIALNSEIPSAPGSAQMEWLRVELAANRRLCTAAYWHRPLFSSGKNGDQSDMRPVWRTLHEFGVDLVINGHDHTYERFAPQDPDGRPDPKGIREFVVGTGGAPPYGFPNAKANSEVRASGWGVGVFTLAPGGYQWEFVPVDGGTFRDFGSDSCH